MHYQTRLLRRGANYYFRARIPRDLIEQYDGKREIKFSLGTTDRQEAARLARQRSVDLDQEFIDRRAATLSVASPDAPRVVTVLDASTIQGICALWRHEVLAGDEWYRQEGLSPAEFETLTADRAETAAALRDALARGQIDKIMEAMTLFLTLARIDVRADTASYNRLLYAFLQTVVETTAAQSRRDQGEVVHTPPAPATPATWSQPAVEGPTLEALKQDWVRFAPNRPKKTIDDMARAIRELQALVGNKPATAITRADIMALRDHLLNVAGRKGKTVAKRIVLLSALFSVALLNEKVTSNPAARIPVPNDDSEERLPFDLDDLRTLFCSPLYSTGQRLGRHTGEAGAWLPLLALYTGAREEELGQLLVDDVARIDGIDCLRITTKTKKKQGSDSTPATETTPNQKRLKNKSSKRRLPLHPKLIEAGFLRYVERIRSEGHTRLFPTLKRDSHGKLTAGFSKVFNEYLREAVGIIDTDKVFHSFRHTFRDACREADIDEELADTLMGHSVKGKKDKTGRKYGRGFSLRKLHQAILRIDYPGLEIPVIIAENQ